MSCSAAATSIVNDAAMRAISRGALALVVLVVAGCSASESPARADPLDPEGLLRLACGINDGQAGTTREDLTAPELAAFETEADLLGRIAEIEGDGSLDELAWEIGHFKDERNWSGVEDARRAVAERCDEEGVEPVPATAATYVDYACAMADRLAENREGARSPQRDPWLLLLAQLGRAASTDRAHSPLARASRALFRAAAVGSATYDAHLVEVRHHCDTS